LFKASIHGFEPLTAGHGNEARTGKIPTLDDALKELLDNYKKKSKS